MVDSLVSKAVEKLTDVLSEKIELFAGATDELEKLRDTFQSIQAVLADARRTQIYGNSVQLWLSRLRDVAAEIDKLLDDRLISSSSSSIKNKKKKNNKVWECLSFIFDYVQDIIPRYKMAVEIKDIRERLDQIVKDKNEFFLAGVSTGGGQSRTPDQIGSRPVTTSLQDELEIISMEEDKEAVISRLLLLQIGKEEDDQNHHHHRKVVTPHVQLVAIVGDEESGKTNLARQIFHDGKVQDFFEQDNLYWVCVTDVFDMMRLTKAILEQVNGTGASLSELNSVQEKLVKSLKGKRFLLVLDDMWNEDERKWEMLRVPLKSGAPGSKILVTTRSDKVAEAMNAAYIHKLRSLP